MAKIPEEWIGVDLDGTLAHYDGWKGHDHIGAPIEPMVHRVKQWRSEGITVKIFTARVFADDAQVKTAIQAWCSEHIGEVLPITNQKDWAMKELWDDRAVQIIHNTGYRADGKDA